MWDCILILAQISGFCILGDNQLKSIGPLIIIRTYFHSKRDNRISRDCAFLSVLNVFF